MLFAQHQSGGSIDIIVTSDTKTEQVVPVTEANVLSQNKLPKSDRDSVIKEEKANTKSDSVSQVQLQDNLQKMSMSDG